MDGIATDGKFTSNSVYNVFTFGDLIFEVGKMIDDFWKSENVQ